VNRAAGEPVRRSFVVASPRPRRAEHPKPAAAPVEVRQVPAVVFPQGRVRAGTDFGKHATGR
jgi:hypothetical protein